MKLNGEKLFISKKEKWERNKGFESRNIMYAKTKEASDKGKDITHAKLMDYDDVKEFMEKKRKQLLTGSKKFGINILTNVGWRGSKQFTIDEPIQWVSMENYGDDDDIEEIYAIQIIYYPKEKKAKK